MKKMKYFLWLFTFLSFMLFFSGCSNKFLRPEVSRSSNLYFVRGDYYKPQNNYSYKRTGKASWYGPDCHGKKNAHGKIFNQYAMTAAHRTLPLPTIARVTNLNNNKSVIVLIDDRGPYKYKGRIIDLSYAGAQSLGYHNSGITKVLVEALPEESFFMSSHLKRYGKYGMKTNGKSWEEIYRTEVGGRNGLLQLTKPKNYYDEIIKKEVNNGNRFLSKKPEVLIKIGKKEMINELRKIKKDYKRNLVKKKSSHN